MVGRAGGRSALHNGLMRASLGVFVLGLLGVATAFAADAVGLESLALAGGLLTFGSVLFGSACVLGMFALFVVSVVRDPTTFRGLLTGATSERRIRVGVMLAELDESELRIAEERIGAIIDGRDELHSASVDHGQDTTPSGTNESI